MKQTLYRKEYHRRPHVKKRTKKYMRQYRKDRPEYKPYKPNLCKRTRFKALTTIALNKNCGKVACMNCGFNKNVDLLEINHINGGGRKEKVTRIQFYRSIANKKRTIDDLDILCSVCNIAHFVELKYGIKYLIKYKLA